MTLSGAPHSPEPLGWLASVILLSTIARQIWRPPHAPTVEAMSKWLFIGQIPASVLYLTYSLLAGNAVFVASNAASLATGITGQVIYVVRGRRGKEVEAPGRGPIATVPSSEMAALPDRLSRQ